jgi:hypothetical protein
MLSFKLEGDILEVKEVSMSWNKTNISYWYYDIVNWLDNANGKKEPLDRKVCPAQIEWVKKYYLPKVNKV